MNARRLGIIAAVAALCVPAIGNAQGVFGFETVPFGTQTSFTETDGGTGVSATFSSLSLTPDAFQVLDNLYPPGTPFFSYNMKHNVLVENSVGDHTLNVHFDALQKTLHISFGLPNLAAQLILDIPSLGVSQAFSGVDNFPGTPRDLPYEGEIDFNAGALRFTDMQLHTVGATDGAFGIDNVRVAAVPEGSSLAMFALGGLPIGALILRKRKKA